jgi:hypothetical protein
MAFRGTSIVEIRKSLWMTVGLIVGGPLFMTPAIIFLCATRFQAGNVMEFLVSDLSFELPFACAIFFGLATLIGLWQLFFVRGPIVTVTPDGIRDRRLAAELIPWSAVSGISAWQGRRVRGIVLDVDPLVESQLTLTRMARWARAPNRQVGIEGLLIEVTGLNVNFDRLLGICRSHVLASRRTHSNMSA